MTGKPIGSVARLAVPTPRARASSTAWPTPLAAEGFTLDGARVAIQGFGNVGEATARLLAQAGALIVAVTDVGGGVRR